MSAWRATDVARNGNHSLSARDALRVGENILSLAVGSMTELAHKVKIATTVKAGRCTHFVVECVCGWNSALHASASAANAAYAAHKSGSVAADFLPAFDDRGAMTREVL